MDIKAFHRDGKTIAAIDDGVWVDDLPNSGTVRLKVRGLSSKIAQAVRSRKERAAPQTDRDRLGDLTDEAANRVTREVLAEAILLDWDNLTSDGEPIKYDPTLAREWLTNPEYRLFQNTVIQAALIVDGGKATPAVVAEKLETKEANTKN